jgi:hypothetical protein
MSPPPAFRAARDSALTRISDKQLQKNLVSPWVPVKDPAGSGKVYYWNKETDETTHVGAPKPLLWIEEADPNGSDITYWWCLETGQSTSLGAPRPSPFINQEQEQQFVRPVSFGEFMKANMIAGLVLGVGVSLAFIAFR